MSSLFSSLLYRMSRLKEKIDQERREKKPDSLRLLRLHAMRAHVRERIELIVHHHRLEGMRRHGRMRQLRAFHTYKL